MRLEDSVGKIVKFSLFGSYYKIISIKDTIKEKSKKRRPHIKRDGVLVTMKNVKNNRLENVYKDAKTKVYSPLKDTISSWCYRPHLFEEGCVDNKVESMSESFD